MMRSTLDKCEYIAIIEHDYYAWNAGIFWQVPVYNIPVLAACILLCVYVFMFTNKASSVSQIIAKSECGKSAVPDGICVEYLKFSSIKIHALLALCFSLCLFHSLFTRRFH